MSRLAGLAAALILTGAPAWGEDEPFVPVNPAAIDDLTFEQLTACNGDIQWEANLRYAEEPAAIAAVGQARRSGRVLQVGKARYVDKTINPDTGAGESHGLVGRYRAMPLVLVGVAWFEGDAFFIVDPASGQKVEAAALPLPDPSGRTLAGATREHDYDAPSIELTDFESGRLTYTRIETPFPCGLKWISPDELDFRVLLGSPMAERLNYVDASVRREGGKWVYHGPTGPP